MAKIMLNNLAADYQSAGVTGNTALQQSIKSQIDNLVNTLGDGQTFQDITGKELNIFGNNNINGPNVQAVNGATSAGITPAAPGTTGTLGATAVDGNNLTGTTGAKASTNGDGPSNVDDNWGVERALKKDVVGGRTAEEHQRDVRIIDELSDELGIGNGEGSREIWEKMSINDDRITLINKKTGQKIDAATAEKIDAEYTRKRGLDLLKGGYIMEVQSQKYGLVKIQVGGDGEINGRDDKIISMGGEITANNMEAGLTKISNDIQSKRANSLNDFNDVKATAQSVTALPQVAQMTALNPELGQMVDQVQDPYNLNASEIKNLIAAIMLIINKNAA